MHIFGESTGFPNIDRIIMGLKKSTLIALASRPEIGKTSLALNIALNVAKQSRKAVAVFSPDMPKADIVTRLFLAESRIKRDCLEWGVLGESDWRKMEQSCVSLSNLGIYVDDSPTLTVAGMCPKCRKIENLGLVVVDSLQAIIPADEQSAPDENCYQPLANTTQRLKTLARALEAPVLCTSQLNRDFKERVKNRDYKRPLLSDLRDWGTIEDDADIVMFLHRDDYYCDSDSEKNITECIIAKNREGRTGLAELRWIPECFCFESTERENYG